MQHNVQKDISKALLNMSKKREYCKHIEPAKKPGKEYMITKDNDSVTR